MPNIFLSPPTLEYLDEIGKAYQENKRKENIKKILLILGIAGLIFIILKIR